VLVRSLTPEPDKTGSSERALASEGTHRSRDNSAVFLLGLNQRRIANLVKAAVARCSLDLSGLTVLTEGATGGYSVTPVLAAVAKAKDVYAMTRGTRFGSVNDVVTETLALARLCGVEDRIQFLTEKSRDVVSRCDVVTNSGHLRPLDAQFISWMKPNAVISLMYEAWELRAEDIDLSACRDRGITVAGVDETNPLVDVFSYLPMLAARQLFECGVPVYKTRILILCDNRFEPYLKQGLARMGADIDCFHDLLSVPLGREYDAVLVSMTPRTVPVISEVEARILAERWPGIIVVQFFGDMDRASLAEAGIFFFPVKPPALGHMGVFLTDVGPDAIVRLQTGGLKVGEILARGLANASAEDRDYLQLF
jgi:hypothetical protein